MTRSSGGGQYNQVQADPAVLDVEIVEYYYLWMEYPRQTDDQVTIDMLPTRQETRRRRPNAPTITPHPTKRGLRSSS